MRFMSKAAAKVRFFFDSAKCFDHKKTHRLSTSNFLHCVCAATQQKSRDVVFAAPLQSMFYALCSMLFLS